jgi:hypothetical protein
MSIFAKHNPAAEQQRADLKRLSQLVTERDERLRGPGPELPCNRDARLRNEKRLAEQSPEAERARHEAAAAAARQRNVALQEWQRFRKAAEDAATAADHELHRAIEARDLDAAIAAATRLEACRRIPPQVNDVIRVRFSTLPAGRTGPWQRV